MAPRKRTGSGAKKPSNQSKEQPQQPSQPSKFGIQHFFDRHSQSQKTQSHKKNGSSDCAPLSNQNPEPSSDKKLRNDSSDAAQVLSQDKQGMDTLDKIKSMGKFLRCENPSNDAVHLSRFDGNGTNLENGLEKTGNLGKNGVCNLSRDRTEKISPVVIDVDDDENQLDVSPETSKNIPLKRFKFSPGMSQDDVVDEVTWRISPVNERLQAVSKHLPGMIRVLADSSKFNSMNFHQCSQKKEKNSLDMSGKLEKWLSSPPPKASENSMISSNRAAMGKVKSDHEANFHVDNSVTNSDTKSEVLNSQSPFSTPPSLSFCQDKACVEVSSIGVPCDPLGSKHHKKALIELLDEVEDVIYVEDSSCKENKTLVDTNRDIKANNIVNQMATKSEENSRSKDSNVQFLVLEVSAESSSSQSSFKVLRLLNEQSGVERAVRLWDQWYYSVVAPGDTVHVIGEFDAQGKCDVNREKNLLIVHPDILVSGTRVSSSFSCPRRTVLDERLKNSEHATAALIGTLLHQIFQAGLLSEFPTREFLEGYSRTVLQKSLESLYACGVNENEILKTLIEAIPKILNWISRFRDSKGSRSPSIDFKCDEGLKKLKISEVIDIEEMAWAPKYGLKGMIDASVRVRTSTNSAVDNAMIMPLEFKSGKATTGQAAMEHNAQVMLYTLLMSDRYMMNIDQGLLYYLHTDHTQGISVERSDLIGLIMRRNELANDLLRASTAQELPPMLQSSNMCKGCRHLSVCSVYHKAYGGTTEGSGLGEMYDSLVSHLTETHTVFLQKWERLVDLESRHLEDMKKESRFSENLRNDSHQSFLSSLILDAADKSTQKIYSRTNRFVYRFLRGVSLSSSSLDSMFRSGDYVILSTELGQQRIANGVIVEIGNSHVSVSFAKRLRIPGRSPSSNAGDLHQQSWRIDKDEFSTSFAIMRYNLIQLFLQSESSSRLRKMIVDLEMPRFESGCISSQDPAISYVCSEKSLNDDQRRAILKILATKDYALILGMPGTGKTTTMVHAVKALLMRGASILLTSYTNSAVDNLLIKLKAQGIDFIRIGRPEAVHEEVQENCLSVMDMASTQEIKQKMNNVSVVAVTCLGISSPLLTNKRFDICIMDEAGQITLPISLGPLMLASKFVLVGDHYQLPPLVQSSEARENGMDVSLFCRLSEAHSQAIAALHYQYRMCASIMELSNALIYGNRLRCGSSEIENAKIKYTCSTSGSSWLMEVLNPNQPVIFINTDLLPAYETNDRKAVNNVIEAYIIAEVTKALLLRGIEAQEIGIITPYNSQANLIRGSVSQPVEIHTIDKYQGRDKDCILVSFVRSSENPRNNASSLLGDWHRINVAITRAKKKLIMVGSCRTLSKVPLLKLLIEKVDELSGMLVVNKKEINYKVELKRCSQLR